MKYIDGIDKILSNYKDIDQSKIYEDVLTNIFENYGQEHIVKSIPKDVFKLRAILLKETDRGAALMAVSYLENLLRKLLMNFFVDDTSLSEKLLKHGELSSFDTKKDLAY